ncbi:MAG: sensor histidine kinase [bacterium]
MQIGKKLNLGFILIFLLMALNGAIYIYENRAIQHVAQEDIYRSFSNLNYVWELMETVEHQQMAANRYLLLEEGLDEERVNYFEEKERFKRLYRDFYSEADAHERQWLDDFYSKTKAYNLKLEDIFVLKEQGIALKLLKEKIKETEKIEEVGHTILIKIIEHVQKEHVEPAKKDIAEKTNMTIKVTILSVIISLLLALGLGYYLTNSISGPIKKLKEATIETGKGNLDSYVKIKSKDEIGILANAFNLMLTELKKSQDQIRSYTRQLEQAMSDLKRRSSELEKINAELDNFNYIASHDLRAPLRTIGGFADLLKKRYQDKLDETGHDFLSFIQKGVEQMKRIIADLLTLSQISRIHNPYEDVNLNELLHAVKERLIFDIIKFKVNLKIQEDLPTIQCDRIKMNEVFFNLINNAIKFSSKNNKIVPEVEVGYRDADEFNELFVKDNGIGIEPKYHEQIFGIFRRLHTDKEYEGTGVGLNIVKQIIDDHQGRIWVESELGKGTTFYFTIPKNLH